jgi:hypothetical protein
MTDTALLGEDDQPATVVGFGPVPAAVARQLVRDASEDASVWLRRLYTHPDTGRLVAMESGRREFPAGLRRFLVCRDQLCRTPWCDAPVRHADHAVSASAGGPTSAANGQALCESCNYLKESPGWSVRVDSPGVVTTTTPTRHAYDSTAPPLTSPRRRPSAGDGLEAAALTELEKRFLAAVAAA